MSEIKPPDQNVGIPENPEAGYTGELPEVQSRDVLGVIKRAAQTGVIVAELLPTNEAIRYGALGVAMATVGPDPLVGAATLGGSTLVVEGAAALATADILTTDRSKRVINRINESLHKVIPEEAKMSKVTEAGVALYGGSVVVMAEKQREDPSRTMEENRKYGLFTASWMSGVLALEGAAIASGIDNITDPKTIGASLIALGGIAAATKWARNHIRNDIIENRPRYDLSEEELKELEQGLVSEVKSKVPEEGVSAVWIRPDNKYANFIRTHEAHYFPEVEEVTEEEEKNTLFMVLVDTREDENRVVHAATVMKPKDVADYPSDQPTGFFTVDHLIALGNFKTDEFYDYYSEKGIDISKSISVETNFRVGDRIDYNGVGSADLAYIALLQSIKSAGGSIDQAAVFATLNEKQINSFERIDIDFDSLMGMKDFKTPEEELDIDSKPVAIVVNDKSNRILGGMGISIPELILD